MPGPGRAQVSPRSGLVLQCKRGFSVNGPHKAMWLDAVLSGEKKGKRLQGAWLGVKSCSNFRRLEYEHGLHKDIRSHVILVDGNDCARHNYCS